MKEKKEPKGPGPSPVPQNVVAMPSRCPVEGCGKKATKAEFCDEHFIWFKEGLISRDGKKPKDFDKKYRAYMARVAKKAA